MQRRFPFFEFIWKGPEERGHARSLNLIRQAVRTPWLVHLEDDWHFFARRPYIGLALEILEENPGLGQVLFNRNYAETLEDREIVGGFPRRSRLHGHRYVVHEHYPPGSEEYRAFREAHPGRSSAWWPHYSLRPAVLRTSVFERVGPFDEAAPHFEHDYGERFLRAGFAACFLDGVYSLHSGRLTGERGDTARANAYDLNEQRQFVGAPPANLDQASRPTPAVDGRQGRPGPLRGQRFVKELTLRVINLDRRADRLEAFRRHVVEVAGPDLASRIERFAAIDGRTLSLTPDIQHTFRSNNFTYRRSYIGCALSHLALWGQLARGEAPAFLVLEDDVTLCPGFEGQLAELGGELVQHHPAFDLLLLGYFDWQPLPQDDFETGYRQARLRGFDGERYIGGLYAYIVSRRGAGKLLDIVQRDGIQDGIDRFVHRKAGELEILVATPHIVRSQLVPPGSRLDSDIQNDFTALSAPGSV
jgi:GR25 family glycosyltransferase involved in LPS biosynthesis